MISVLRQSLKSHAYRIFLWLFFLMMLFGGLSFDFADTSRWAVKVYKEKITDVQWHQSLINAQKQLDYIKSLGINWPQTEPLDKEVLRRSVNNLLLQHNAKELGLVVPAVLINDELDTKLHNLPQEFFDASGRLNIRMLEQQIAPSTFDTLLDEIETEISSNLIHNIVALGTSYVSQFEVASQYHEEYTNKKYSIVTFSQQKALEQVKKNAVSDEVLERFYKKNEHGDMYKSVEKRAGVCWKFDAHNYGIHISDQEISAYYDKNKKAEYLEAPAQAQVRRIWFDAQSENAHDHIQAIHDELIADPTTFKAVAKKIVASKQKGQGSETTDFFAKDSTVYDKVLVDTAFEQLTQDDEISEIIKTDKGYEVLQRVARKSATYKQLTQVKDQIRTKLTQEKFAKRFKQDAERIAGSAQYSDAQAIQAFVEKRKGHKETLALEAKKPGVVNMQLFQTEQGNYAVFMDDKSGVLLQCTEVTKKALKPFHEVKSMVTAHYYKKMAHDEMEVVACDAIKQAAHKDLAEIAVQYDAVISSAEFTYQDGKAEYSSALRPHEILQKVKTLQSVGEMIDVVTATESLLIRLDQVEPINEELFVEKSQNIKKTLESKAKHKGRDSFIASLYRHAKLNSKIEIKDQLLKDAKETV